MLQLWRQCKGFVATMARKYQGRGEMDDLMQEGYIALCEAVKAYDPERGMSFINYSAFYIRRHMALCCQKGAGVSIPLDAQNRVQSYHRLVSDFSRMYGKEPTDRELCAMLGLSRKQLEETRRMARAAQTDSLDRPLDTDEAFSVGDTVQSGESVEDDVLDAVQQEQLAELLWPMVDALEGQQAEIIRARYQEGMGWNEITQQTGMSRSQAHTCEKNGLSRLRTSQRAGELRAFLNDYISAHAYRGNGAGAFNRTWTSSTERTVLELEELEDRATRSITGEGR
ncbi:MAG: sigma-70 family RNA polymerase sigma factor [Clostridiales bacterium]|nr:sigma-70 family RNA polymerase sigma factor [Clostridiales bacterium]